MVNKGEYLILHRFALLSLLIAVSLASSTIAAAETKRETYFTNTQYQLDVFRIYGRERGNTMLIIGGIQDEPGGYLTADMYADLSLARGNLIVVPRANMNTIIHGERGVNGDMNRKFAYIGEPQDYDDRIVTLLKKLIGESDAFLNLHSGSGYYRDEFIDKMHNPLRYGQSIIADASEYISPRTGKIIRLRETAMRVSAEVNQLVADPHYHFRFNNHRTGDPNTMHVEQRKSATYFALTKIGIPAFGLEVSNALPTIEMKVRHMMWMINAFLREFEIIPEFPSPYLEPPELQFLVVSVNDGDAIVVNNEAELHVRPRDEVEVRYIQANYERGLTVDILGCGTVQDFQKSTPVEKDTRVIVRKDNYPCGHIWIRVRGEDQPHVLAKAPSLPSPSLPGSGEEYLSLAVNGKKRLLMPEDTVRVLKGDMIHIIDISPALKSLGNIDVNFYGYVPPNKSAEDRGYTIDTGKDLFSQYAVDADGRLYEIRIQKNGESLRRFHVNIIEPELKYIVIKQNDHTKLWVQNNETLEIDPESVIQIVDMKTNIPDEQANEIKVNFKGYYGRGDGDDLRMDINIGRDLLKQFSKKGKGENYEIEISRKGFTFGRVLMHIRGEPTDISMIDREGKD